MLLVVGAHGIARYHDIEITLIGVDCRRSHASVSVDAGEHDRIDAAVADQLAKAGPKERAVSGPV